MHSFQRPRYLVDSLDLTADRCNSFQSFSVSSVDSAQCLFRCTDVDLFQPRYKHKFDAEFTEKGCVTVQSMVFIHTFECKRTVIIKRH